jgi:predicted metal-binding membrane protein
MLLLFVGGVTNLFWPAGVAALVLLEKAAPAGPSLAQLAGLGLMVSAAVLLGLDLAELAISLA